MVKIAIVADSHYDEHSRFQECINLHEWIQCDSAKRGCSLLLHAGDLFERRSTPRERVAVVNWFADVAMAMPVVLVRGNHDAIEEHELWPELRTRHPIHTYDATGFVVEAGVMVAAMAWPRKANVEAAGVDAREAMRATLRGLGDMMAEHDGPRVLLTHAMVRGSRTSTGQELLGCELELGLEDLALARADLYALGHIHAHQHWMVGNAPAIYPGSPRRANFGELEPKGYVVAEFDGRQLVGCEFVEVPATPMVHVDDEWGLFGDDMGELSGKMGWLAGAHGLPRSCEGAELRFRYRVASEFRDQARAAAQRWRDEWLAEGALSVKVEEQVLATTRARSPEVARAVTLVDKLDALWSARRDVPDPVRRDALVAKLGELESSAGT